MNPRRGSERTQQLVEDAGGVLPLEPAWVARSFLPPGRRLGLAEDAYDLGVRGAVCERWLASTTPADNAVPHPLDPAAVARAVAELARVVVAG